MSATHPRSQAPTRRQDQCSIQSDLEEVTCLAGDTDTGTSHPTAPAEEGGNSLRSQGNLHRRGSRAGLGRMNVTSDGPPSRDALRVLRKGKVEAEEPHREGGGVGNGIRLADGAGRWGTTEGGPQRTDYRWPEQLSKGLEFSARRLWKGPGRSLS